MAIKACWIKLDTLAKDLAANTSLTRLELCVFFSLLCDCFNSNGFNYIIIIRTAILTVRCWQKELHGVKAT